ncbi:MAG: baseplate J/gp47 family protein [Candidatus Spyradocola sp.]
MDTTSEESTNLYGEDIHLTTIDSTSIYNTLIHALEKGAGEPLYPGDERRIYGEALAAVFVALYNTMDDVGRQTLLRYARGEVLDAIGERLDVKRLAGDKATTTMRFSLSKPRPTNIIIPKWTKVTADGENYFATDEIAVLQAGTYNVEVPTSAVVTGEKFNGYAVGTITTLVDLIPYIESVTNLTTTTGGDDGEPYTKAGDDRLRERIRLAPAKRSTAGPQMAYIYWAMTADSSIVDVKAVSEIEHLATTLTVYDGHAFLAGPLEALTLVVKASETAAQAMLETDFTYTYKDNLLDITLLGSLASAESIYVEVDKTLEGCVKIVPLLEGGQVPDAAIMQKVLEACSPKDVRPLTDKVSVVAPETVTYDIELVYYVTPTTEAEAVASVEGTNGAIQRFNDWQTEALGRDINPDKLRALILCPHWEDDLTGAIRVDIVKPQHTTVEDTQVAKFSGNLKVSHKSVTGVV